MFTKSHPKAAHQYALDVTEGRIVAGQYVKLACERFLRDIERDDIEFDEAAAQRACNFMQALPHVKGKWAAKSEKLKLEPWQVFIECRVAGRQPGLSSGLAAAAPDTRVRQYLVERR